MKAYSTLLSTFLLRDDLQSRKVTVSQHRQLSGNAYTVSTSSLHRISFLYYHVKVILSHFSEYVNIFIYILFIFYFAPNIYLSFMVTVQYLHSGY